MKSVRGTKTIDFNKPVKNIKDRNIFFNFSLNN